MKIKTLGTLDWLVLLTLLVFTSGGTAGLVAITSANTGGLALIVRQLAAVLFTDGAILFWHNRYKTFEDGEQIRLAKIAMWCSVAVVLSFTVLYGVESVLLGDVELQSYKVMLGDTLSVPLSELLGFMITAILAVQAAGTLGLVLYIETLNPRHKMLMAQRASESVIHEKQLKDYAAAQVAIAPLVGQAQAVSALREQLAAMNYTEREVETLVLVAMARIADTKATNNGTGNGIDNAALPVNSAAGGKSLAESFFGVNRRVN